MLEFGAFLIQTLLSVILLVVLIATGYIVNLYYSNKEYYELNSKIPGFKKWPIVGDLLHMKLDPIDYWKQICRLLDTNRHRGVFDSVIGMRHQVILTRPKEIEKLLGSTVPIDKAAEYFVLKPWLGLGLLISGGNLWRSRRRLLTPSFHFNILHDFLPVINDDANNLKECLQQHTDTGKAFNISPYVSLCALDMINETALGTKLDALQNENSDYVTAVKLAKDLVFKRFTTPWLWPDLIFNFTETGRKHNAAVKLMHDYTKKIISDRRAAKDGEEDYSKYKAFLDTLLDCRKEDGTPLTDEEIQVEVDTFLFEGHDTTTAAVEHTIYLIGAHPEVQRKCQKEFDEIFDAPREITWKDLSKFTYLEWCIKEAMRIYPPVPLFARCLPHNMEFGGYTVSKDTNISVVAHVVHMDPEIYPDPEKFDPTRFSPDNSTGRSPYAYIPFSAGPRNCIGQRLAMMEMKVVIATILGSFNIESTQARDDIIDNPGIVLDSVSGIWIKLSSR